VRILPHRIRLTAGKAHEGLAVRLGDGVLIAEPIERGAGFDMVLRVAFLVVQVVATLTVVIPLAWHAWLNRRWMRLGAPLPPACADADLPFLCVVVPTWNEAAVIEAKLSDFLAQRYPSNRRRFLLIDSASTDDTVALATAWDKAHSAGLEIVTMPARLGKSAAINRVIEELRSTDEVFVMTDAEALLEAGALRRIGRWMKDDSIGAVCGTPGQDADSEAYRDWYRWFREGESRADSTPIFEGSIAAYRISAVQPVEAAANADDSQLAVIVRASGLRAISDGAIRFHETPLTDPKERRDRIVRRGQGLSRHFWRQRSRWFLKDEWGTILGLNGVQHTITPWCVIIGILAGIAHATTVILLGWSGSEALLLDRVMLLVDALVLASLAIGVARIRVPLCATILAFLEQNLHLARGMLLFKMGMNLHQWKPSKSNRLR